MRREDVDPELLIRGAESYAERMANTDPQFICQAVTWLRQRRWEDDEKQHNEVVSETRVERISATDDEWRRRLEAFQNAGGTARNWPRVYGLPPMHPATYVPLHIRQEFGFA
jgi:hypothetical protein